MTEVDPGVYSANLHKSVLELLSQHTFYFFILFIYLKQTTDGSIDTRKQLKHMQTHHRVPKKQTHST